MACRMVACPECGGACRPFALRTRPLIFECYDCSTVFTRRSRGAPVATLRTIRRQIVQRWDQLADDVHRRLQEIRDAPVGVFTDAERADAEYELNQTVWEVMVNHRPRLPASGRRRATLEARRRLRLHRESLAVLELIGRDLPAEGG